MSPIVKRRLSVYNGQVSDSDHVLAKRTHILGILWGGNEDKGRNLNSKNAETSLARVIMSRETHRVEQNETIISKRNLTLEQVKNGLPKIGKRK